ncbi:MAG: chorismate mutase, partial [Lachnospiraceae bacterium]|nr:chorismate mutase [Lachnospiraceae bacterium]
MSLPKYREEIEKIDDEILKLFSKRMETAAKIGAYKKENGLPIHVPAVEKRKILKAIENSPEDIREYSPLLFSLLFEMSRSYQNRLNGVNSELTEKIQKAVDETEKIFPDSPTVACQGVPGAYSQAACERLFRYPKTMYVSSFEAVFSAIEAGLCEYGILPIENSNAGSVQSVYDLMMKHHFYIVRSVR